MWPTNLFGKTLTDRLFYAWPYRLPSIGPTLTTPWEVALLDPVPQKGRGDLRGGGDAPGSSVAWPRGTCSFQKPIRGLGIAREMLVEPLAQVSLLRSSQRDPSFQTILGVVTGWIEKD